LEAETKAVQALAAEAHGLLLSRSVVSDVISTMPDFQRGTRQRLEKIDVRKRDLTRQIHEQTSKTIEAQRKVKLLEKLRTRRYAEWLALTQKDQENFAAEAFLARWRCERAIR
jgi:phage shock protein A